VPDIYIIGHFSASLSIQSLALVLTTKTEQQRQNMGKHKITERLQSGPVRKTQYTPLPFMTSSQEMDWAYSLTSSPYGV